MALKNKDGSVYRLRGPNPLAKSQDKDSLKEGEIVLHNFNWSGTPVDDIEQVIPMPTDMKIEDVLVIDDPVVMPPEVVKEIPVNTIPVEVPKPTTPEKFKVTVSMFCLPAKLKTVRDDFYGDEYQKRTFGKKFSIEAIMVETSDLTIRFWTTVPFLTKRSIVYPYRYSDGQKYGEFRWWEIQAVEEKSGGYLADAVISTVQPDFGD